MDSANNMAQWALQIGTLFSNTQVTGMSILDHWSWQAVPSLTWPWPYTCHRMQALLSGRHGKPWIRLMYAMPQIMLLERTSALFTKQNMTQAYSLRGNIPHWHLLLCRMQGSLRLSTGVIHTQETHFAYMLPTQARCRSQSQEHKPRHYLLYKRQYLCMLNVNSRGTVAAADYTFVYRYPARDKGRLMRPQPLRHP